MQTYTVTSVAEIVTAVEGFLSAHGGSWLWFRGHTSLTWKLQPAVHRGYNSEDERSFFNEFYQRALIRYDKCPEKMDFAGWLALMQHYGLPTRLLDWSKSPLVAAYFATQNLRYSDATEDACVWMLVPGTLK